MLLVGFAYVWKRGDLDWVRAMIDQAKQAAAPPLPSTLEHGLRLNPLNPNRSDEGLTIFQSQSLVPI